MSKRFMLSLSLFLSLIFLTTIGGVFATWSYSDLPIIGENTTIPLLLNGFDYTPDLPEGEVSFLERLSDILNNQYSNDIIPDGQSMSYLLSWMINL